MKKGNYDLIKWKNTGIAKKQKNPSKLNELSGPTKAIKWNKITNTEGPEQIHLYISNALINEFYFKSPWSKMIG